MKSKSIIKFFAILFFISCSSDKRVINIDSNLIQSIEVYKNENVKELILKIESKSEISNLINLLNTGEKEIVKFKPKYCMYIILPKKTEVVLFNDKLFKYNSTSYGISKSLYNKLSIED